MIALNTPKTRRFHVERSTHGWIILDMAKHRIMRVWFDSQKNAQELADRLEEEAR